MKWMKSLLLTVLAGLLVSFPHTDVCAGPPSKIAALYDRARGGSTFYHPDDREMIRARQLFSGMFAGAFFEEDAEKPAWKTLGFRAVDVREDGRRYVAVMEDGARKGRGFYLFAARPESRTALMVPHGDKDLRTGDIGMALMSAGEFVGGAFNTMPRYAEDGDKGRQQDMAHAEDTYFVAYTKAFADVFPSGRLVQIHGFASEKRKTDAGRNADGIISSGSAILPPTIFKLKECLRQTRFNFLVYPLEVRELGGTTNISGNVLQSMGHSGFVHFEISYPVRKRLTASPELLEMVENCLELEQ